MLRGRYRAALSALSLFQDESTLEQKSFLGDLQRQEAAPFPIYERHGTVCTEPFHVIANRENPRDKEPRQAFILAGFAHSLIDECCEACSRWVVVHRKSRRTTGFLWQQIVQQRRDLSKQMDALADAEGWSIILALKGGGCESEGLGLEVYHGVLSWERKTRAEGY